MESGRPAGRRSATSAGGRDARDRARHRPGDEGARRRARDPRHRRGDGTRPAAPPGGAYGNCIRVLVPLVISDAELDEALGVWEDALGPRS